MLEVREPTHEGLLAEIWCRQWLVKGRLLATDGQGLEIIHPGEANGDSGPDFRDAIIAAEAGEVRGDVELHVRSSGWRAHGHHLDPAYNGVVLHVALWEDGAGTVQLQSGRTVPTLALHPYLSLSLDELERRAKVPMLPAEPCLQARESLGDAALGRLLDRAGMERFRAKASRFRRWLAMLPPAEALYQGLMEALGYARNQEPFLELARRLPLAAVEAHAPSSPFPDEALCLEALLLGSAGLLPSQRGWALPDEGYVAEVEAAWLSMGRKALLSSQAWHTFRVRPDNFPTRRLAAAARLMLRYHRGLIEGLMQAVSNAEGGLQGLEGALVIGAEGYWGEHIDFGHPAPPRALLGRGRAADMAVNVMLPFGFAWAEASGDQGLKARTLGLYELYPRLSPNRVTRKMEEHLSAGGPAIAGSACRQQGLIHIHSVLCRGHRCPECPLGGHVSG